MSRISTSRRLLAVTAATAMTTVFAAAPGASAAESAPAIVVENGVTQPVFGYTDAIRERLWVESTFDSDGDGVRDRIAIDIMRPRATADGLKVPVVMDASPYYTTLGRGNESQLKQDFDNDGLLDQWPLFYDNYFVPRGYAVVLLDMAGTGNSTGCPTTGGRSDNLSAKMAINWLNGRAIARDADGNVVRATWHNGRTGMIGKSYDGALAMATSVTGVDGLTTIVPIGGVSEWYDYTRSNGLTTRSNHYPASLSNTVTNPDRRAYCKPVRDGLSALDGDATGDYDSFWNERSYTNPAKAAKIKSSVFLVHGINDNNVKPDHMSKYWYALAENNVPRKLWITQTGHVDPFEFRRAEWVDTLHRWFDYWLQGVENGIMDEPMVDIERSADVWETYADWPVPGTEETEIFFKNGENAGSLTLVPVQRAETASFKDLRTQSQNAMINNPTAPNPNRLVFLSEPLTAPLHISGTPVIKLRLSADQTDTHLGAILMDYGQAERVLHTQSGEGIITLETKDCWGESSEYDSACYKQAAKRVGVTDQELVTKGVMDAKNRTSIRFETPLVPGQKANFEFPLLPEDYVFEAGHRIGVIIVGSYSGYSATTSTTAANIELALKSSKIVLPIVGGAAAASAAGL
jgi:X-Pro dipeptidyl-peptidase